MEQFRNRFIQCALILIVSVACLSARQASGFKFSVTPDAQAALDRISADSLRGHLSFIASDLLEGRDTPSPGLDIAADYIAAQFRRAGLEPAGDDGYFQTANWILSERSLDGFELQFQLDKQTLSFDKNSVSIMAEGALNTERAPMLKLAYSEAAPSAGLVKGKVILTEMPSYRREERSRRIEMARAQNEFLAKMKSLGAALVISVDRSNQPAGPAPARLLDPQNRPAAITSNAAPLIILHDARAAEFYDRMKQGDYSVTVSVKLGAPVEKSIKLRNVLGLLRGSDPALKDSYVLVTAHYDHIGKRFGGEGDNIFNGANDDGSGTVSVIELASALASLKQRPRRSIVFMTFFGEEKGLLGSRYYGRNPRFPIEKTVANINLEQVGRTDSTEGPQLSSATLTGFDYSDVGEVFKEAGRIVGVNVYKHERNSDAFFGRSDNQALADQGVPAHTLCTTFVYPDYHGVADHWDKIDYNNLEKINRLIAVALLMIAENPAEPRWNESNPKASRYVKAWKDRRNGQ